MDWDAAVGSAETAAGVCHLWISPQGWLHVHFNSNSLPYKFLQYCSFWQSLKGPVCVCEAIRVNDSEAVVGAAGIEAGSDIQFPAKTGSIPGVAEEALLLAEAAEGSNHTHKGKQQFGACPMQGFRHGHLAPCVHAISESGIVTFDI